MPPFAGAGDMPQPDIYVFTSAGQRICAHSKILASASPVLESMIEKHQSTEPKITITGVPFDAVHIFLQFMYFAKCSHEQMDKYGMHLLALSHVYSVQRLKQVCTRGLARRLNVENVVDVLQLARLCDAPDLYLQCMRFLTNSYKAVEETEAWNFLQDHDPHLELQILQYIDENELRRKRTRRHRREQSLYMQLSEAMDCLEHICSEGCMSVGPCDMDPNKHKGPCSKFSTCQGIQLLIKHFGVCKKRGDGGCSRCTRMLQLFKLHSSICDEPDECRVPLCRQFKLKAQQDGRGNDARWRLLVKKVVSARTISSLSLTMRKGVDEPRIALHPRRRRRFSL
ncbi:BTB/POZ and TAZ domain-containing protein 1-like [Salvia hispanica]|uniref:BTB/POZ and TAZ domain-containing protein 1-like n=1 Tax=Salvia hispanica TaxID=49212 RepID=UPI0020090AB8|nr:BTB/POZ and TAZ domain-containing protein 1-like [Salvia hispanica]